MKVIKLFFVLILVSIVNISVVNAQCTPTFQSSPGLIFPEQGFEINPAAATGFWSLNVTVIVPEDTAIPPVPSVPIDSCTIKEFIGFPSGFSYAYNTPSEWWHGNTAGCVFISGTPDVSDIGVHDIHIVFKALLAGTFNYTDTLFNYWSFEVKDASHVGISEAGDVVEDLTISPNPAKERITVVSKNEIEEIAVYTITGHLARTESIEGNGLVVIDVSSLRPGMYIMVITTNAGVENKRIIISE